MYISLDWISEYVDLAGIDTATIVSRLTLATAEVEGVKEIKRFVKGVLVGEIKNAEKLSDKLTFCTVDCGTKIYTTVCGASNVRAGLKSAFAPAGTTVSFNKVEETEKHGKKSQGMLCSAAELGMSHWHENILEIPANIPAGTELAQYIPETDTLIEIDNKSLTHRPDLWGHYGFAREFAAVFGRKLKPLPQVDLSQYGNLPVYPLKNEDKENCPAFSCIEFSTHGTVPSPLHIQRRLHALGLRTYNLLVDVTNYVNWEIAQPTHAYDADKLGGIVIERAAAPTEFQTLDGQTRKILTDDLLIWGGLSNKQGNIRPVGLAGVMGGLETEVTEGTTKILLESANFRAACIRKTAGRLNLKSDASQRYEKSQPPVNTKTGIARILQIIDDAGTGLNVLSQYTLDGDLQDTVRHIVIPADRFNTLAGITLPPEKIESILTSLGFTVTVQNTAQNKTFIVGVPAFRSQKDIAIPEDIVEEVLRIYGYDNIPPVMPEVAVKPLFREQSIVAETAIKRIFTTGHKFLEAHNYIWFNDNWLKQIGFEPDETLVLKNPVAPECSRLRTTLVPNLLALIPKNRPYYQEFNVFEIARTFTTKNGACREEKRPEELEKHQLAGLAFQQFGSFDELQISVKDALTSVFGELGLEPVFELPNERKSMISAVPWLGGDTLSVIANGIHIGFFGTLPKDFLNKVIPEGGQVVWFEFELDKMFAAANKPANFIAPARYPLSWMDFSLVWQENEGYQQLESLLTEFVHPLTKRREFVTLYKGKGLDKGMASYTFRYYLGADDRTLASEEIESFHAELLAFVKEKGIMLRA